MSNEKLDPEFARMLDAVSRGVPEIHKASLIHELRAEIEKLLRERDQLRAECASMSAEFDLPPTIRPAEGEIRRMREEWKQARAEVERLRRLLSPDSGHAGGGVGEGSWAVFAEKVVAERDAFREELSATQVALITSGEMVAKHRDEIVALQCERDDLRAELAAEHAAQDAAQHEYEMSLEMANKTIANLQSQLAKLARGT